MELRTLIGPAQSSTAVVNKYGLNTSMDAGVTSDVWDGGRTGGESPIWVPPQAARNHTIASDSALDTDGDVGAHVIRVTGLTDWDTPEVVQDATLDTGSPPTVGPFVIVHRMEVIHQPGSGLNVGTVSATADVDGTVTAQILPLIGQTRMAIYGIPSSRVAAMGLLYCNCNLLVAGGVGAVDAALLFNANPDIALDRFVVKRPLAIITSGTSDQPINFFIPKLFRGPGILKIQATSNRNGMAVLAGFDLALFDSNLVT